MPCLKEYTTAALIAGALQAMIMIVAMPQAALAAHAFDPPWPGCRPAAKLEYQSARRQGLLHNLTGEYVRTGRVWHRFYWYCPD